MSQPYSPSSSIPGRYDSLAFEKDRLVTDKAVLFLAATCYNKGGATVYLMVFDKSTTGASFPTDQKGIVEVPPGTARSIDWTLAPVSMQAGLYVAVSTSDTALTLPATNDVLLGVAYAFK